MKILLKKLLYNIFFKNFSIKYNYMLEPIQLSQFISEISRTSDIEGSIVEVGAFRGLTTCFVLEHMKNEKINKTYYAIDTFEGFLSTDVDYEVYNRNKNINLLKKSFKINSEKIFKKNFLNYPNLITIKSDCSLFDFKKINPIAVCLIDVDLYSPTKKTLHKVYDNLIEGGTILVDDCTKNENFDGAFSAYKEFVNEIGVDEQYIGNKCGVIKKNKK